jgi:hypothetical protein
MERSTLKSAGKRTFLRIPGLADEHAGTTLTIDGLPCSIADCLDLLLHNDLAISTRALTILSEVSSPTRSEAHAIADAVHQLTLQSETPIAPLAERSLCKFISSNLESAEIISIGAQWVRTWGHSPSPSTAKHELFTVMREKIVKIRFTPIPGSTSKIVEARHILCRAFESEQLRPAAAEAIHAILTDEHVSLSRDRRMFAEHFLSVFRSIANINAQYTSLRRIASAVFTTGSARPSTSVKPHVRSTYAAAPISPHGDAEPTALSPKARLLIDTLIADRGSEFAARLMANDYEIIRKAQGLSLDEFRTLTARIRSRAASDPWARVALLDLVRAPHEPSVSSSVRTAVLGGFISEARKLGRLSSQIEKEVFAISAEIPALPFLQDQEPLEEDTGPSTSKFTA